MKAQPTAVVSTPLGVEHRAVLDLLSGRDPTEHTHDGSVYEVTRLPGRHCEWRLVLALTSRRNEDTSAAVERAIAVWRPEILLLVGVAGGLRDSAVGDVVAATKVYGYESGQDTDTGLIPRVDALRCSHALDQRAHRVSSDGSWTARLGLDPEAEPPRVFHRPIASGSKVVTGTESATADLIRRSCGDAQGLDMEGYGAMAAAWRSKGVEAMVVRGISDLLADKTKAADRTRQPLAARNAAAFALALIEQSEPGTRPAKPAASAEPTGPKYIGAIGDGATANVAAFGDNARGRMTVNHRPPTTE